MILRILCIILAVKYLINGLVFHQPGANRRELTGFHAIANRTHGLIENVLELRDDLSDDESLTDEEFSQHTEVKDWDNYFVFERSN